MVIDEPDGKGIVRGCLIGAGFFARNHMQAWRDLAHEGSRIVGVCDLDEVKARAMSEAFGAEPFTDPAAMIEALSPRLRRHCDDAPVASGARGTLRSAGAARDLPKAIADSLEDATAMVATCETAGATLLIHENFRWQRPFMRMLNLLARALSARRATAASRSATAGTSMRASPISCRSSDSRSWMWGVHLFDLARVFMGEAVAVSCERQRRNPRVAGEDAFTALVAHEGGAVSLTDVSFQSVLRPEPFPQTLAAVEGDEGTLELREDYRLLTHDAAGRREEDVEPPVPAWGEKPWHAVQDSVRSFERHALDVLRGRAAPQPSGADNLRTLALCLAAYESPRTGRRVLL
jgi:predicted dehydrogenase